MMRKIVLTAACTLLLGTGLAAAQQAPAMHEGHLKQLDSNKDGGVSKAEYQAFMQAGFAKLDADGDGSLRREDVGSAVTDKQFKDMDTNGDSRVSRNEFMSQVMKDFASADRSSDGTLK